MTLIELLVVVAILAAIGGTTALAFTMGLKALGPGGAGDRIAAAHDLTNFETQLGTDTSRSSCLSVKTFPPVAATTFGSCSLSLLRASSNPCTAALTPMICLAWPHVASTGSSCHVAVYSQSGGSPNRVTRREYTIASGSTTSAGVTVYKTTAGAVATPSASPLSPASTAPAGNPWPTGYQLTATSAAVKFNAPNGTFVFRPLTDDPAAGTGYSLC